MKYIEQEVSLSKDLWIKIRQKTQEIKDKIKVADIKGTFIKIRRQGSVATRTIINPMISKGKNELDLDIAVVLKKETIDSGSNTLDSLKNEMERIFKNNTFKKKSKALATTFILQHENENIHLGIDIVFLAQDEQNNYYVWNDKQKQFVTSDPFSLIDKFNEVAKENEEIRLNNKIIKALRDSKNCKGLKSIFIINSSLKSYNYNFETIVDQLIEDVKLLDAYGYVYSYTNHNDKILKPENFDLENVLIFLKSIKSLDEDDIQTILGINDNKIKSQNSLLATAPIIGKVHGWE